MNRLRIFGVCFALLLVPTIPATAQPSTVAEILQGLGCSTACVCHPACPSKRCERWRPEIHGPGDVYWPRYGFGTVDNPERPLHISDGTHAAGDQEAQAIVRRLLGRETLTEEEHADLQKVYCGSISARSRLIATYSDAPACSWTSCDKMPIELAQECVAGVRRCTGSNAGAILCYYLARTGKVTYNASRSECDPAQIVVTEPPPPPVGCGDGTCDFTEKRPGNWCVIDCGERPVPPTSNCEEAIDTYETIRAAEVTAWATVVRECR